MQEAIKSRAGSIGRLAAMSLGLVAIAMCITPQARSAFPGVNGKIVFSGNSPSGFDIWSVNPDGTGLTNLTDLPGGTGEGLSPTVNGDGSRIAYTTGSQATAEIWVMHSDGSQPVRLTNNSNLDEFAAFSPDGTRIAFFHQSLPGDPVPNDRDIWIMDGNGTNQSVLLDGFQEDYRSAFTPDGQTLVVQSEFSGSLNIGKIPATGGPFTLPTGVAVTPAPIAESFPDVSPDGSRVAFVRYSTASLPYNHDIYTIGLDGTNQHPVATSAGLQESYPSYSPDGMKMIWSSTDPSTSEFSFVIANSDGTSPAPLQVPGIGSVAGIRWAAGPDPVINPPDPPVDDPALDTTAPQTTIVKAPAKKARSRKATFRFRSSEPGSTFQCRIDAGRFAACGSPKVLRRLKARRHTFRVRATDAAGNVDATPAVARFRVLRGRG